MPLVRLKLASALLIPVAVAGAHTLGIGDGPAPVALAASAAASPIAAAPVRATDAGAAQSSTPEDLLPARGVDVSHYQGAIDWRAVEDAGVGFAFLKATEGTTFVDHTFRRHWVALGETRILRGAYHRFKPTRDAAAQAEHFLAVVPVREGDLPPVLDVEATDGVSDARLIRGVRTWLQTVERRTGVRPIVYTKPGFRRAHLGTALDDYPLWIAEYGVDSPSHDRWTFWQHSEQGRVPGIQKIVDLDRFNGTRADLRQLAISDRAGREHLAER
ncbi:MAG TPA: GH25 family lysozyme [Longimicrobium sp.]|nr:GH25 family lysozyme [Longimicrobium sp.]